MNATMKRNQPETILFQATRMSKTEWAMILREQGQGPNFKCAVCSKRWPESCRCS